MTDGDETRIPDIVTPRDLYIELKSIDEKVDKINLCIERNRVEHKYIWAAVSLSFAVIAFVASKVF